MLSVIVFKYNMSLYLYPKKNLSDNWTFVEELLKLTCNPKVSIASN